MFCCKKFAERGTGDFRYPHGHAQAAPIECAFSVRKIRTALPMCPGLNGALNLSIKIKKNVKTHVELAAVAMGSILAFLSDMLTDAPSIVTYKGENICYVRIPIASCLSLNNNHKPSIMYYTFLCNVYSDLHFAIVSSALLPLTLYIKSELWHYLVKFYGHL